MVDPETAVSTDIPLAQAAEGSFSQDGSLFFARMPRQRSNSRWYKGGTAQQLWKFTPGGSEAEPLTRDYPGSSRQPVVMGNERVYFLSDRVGAMNVWSMNTDGADLLQHTTLKDWDIQELSGDGTTLVYRLGADLWTLDPESGATSKLDVSLMSDVQQSLVEWETSPMDFISDVSISDNGKTVALVSRGELFTAPVGTGRLVHVSRDSGVRYRDVMFTSDSTHVFALSDKSGELEWWKLQMDGSSMPEQITDGPAMLRRAPHPSPNGQQMVHTDYDDHLWLVNLDDGTTKRIAESPIGGDATWSPDSRYVVYSRYMENQIRALFAYDSQDEKTIQITSNRFSDFSATFSEDGNWLFFVSNRTWNSTVGSPWGERAPQPHFEDTGKVYALPLKEGLSFPLTDSDELDRESSPEGDLRWDLGHLLREVPISAGSPRILGANDKRLFYRESGNLMAIDLKSGAEPTQLVAGTTRVILSGNGKQLLVRKGTKIHVIAASSGEDAKLNDENEVELGDWKFAVDKRAEWNEIYHDMWRLHRDYFWDPNMGGVDWKAMRDKYSVLLPRVGSREALADLQGMLVSELSLLHSSAGGGDTRSGDNDVAPASLGGIFERDEQTQGFKLVRRYQADPDLPGEWSPLAHPDVQIAEGAIILSVNGQPTSSAMHIGQLLMDQGGKQVRLAVQDPDGTKRTVVVTPQNGRAEFNLRYHEWEYTRRMETDRLSDGSIGYVHLRAMGRGDIGQWTREFYSQTDKQGLIFDVRHNNGGNIDSWILSQLLRQTWAYFKSRTGIITPNMQYSFSGHLVILVDERSASDGEAVAEGFRRLGLGKAIGVRTWGGEVWLSSSNRQVDGGVTRASETGVYGLEREWLIEGWGFVPDIEVDNLPHATYNGHDAQLEAAVEHLKELIAEDPRLKPEPPPYPVLIPGYGFPTPWRR